ncbi:MAG TPA: glycosyltransferase family 4 protein [Thermoanaerobaculia bacterium]
MRLLWLIDSLNLGGAERLAVTFARAAGGRHELLVCALKTIGGNPMERPLRELGVEVINLEARNLRDRAALQRLAAIVRERRIELIHAHLTYASTWGAMVARRTGVPLVATLHTLPVRGRLFSRDRVRQSIMAFLLRRRASRVIAVSGDQARAWIRRRLLPETLIAVVPNGVELPSENGRFAATTSPSQTPGAGWGANALVLGTAAVLRDGKGIDVLLRAFARVVREAHDITLKIAGDGPLRRHLEREGGRLGLGSHVHWLGYRDDVPSLVRTFDVFVHPALFDALPTAVLEAMAAGVPVVASATGGIPEIITDGENGLLVPPGDEEALAGAIHRLLRHRTMLRELGAAGRARVEAEFSAERWVERLEAIYREAVKGNPGPSPSASPSPGSRRHHGRPGSHSGSGEGAP